MPVSPNHCVSFTVFMQIIKNSLRARSVKRQRIIISIIVQITIVNEVDQIILENIEYNWS